jgi:hypothetical protein
MSNSASTALALALGAGGGFLLWYLLRDDEGNEEAQGKAPPPPPEPSVARQPIPLPAKVPGVCALKLDATGLTADGARVDVSGAVARCKAAGRAELALAKDGPASVYVELAKALADAKVPLSLRAP